MQKLLAILWWFVLPLAVWGGVASWACGQDSLEGGSWSGKITATADAPGSSLTDFFYVVQIDSSQTQFWAAVQNDGDDVRASVDGTQVPCWVDPATFNYAGQSCIVYVMRSGAASSAPVICIYFGNAGASLPAAGATYGQYNAFPSSLKAFYPRGGGNDVTSNANNLTMTGSPTVGGVAGPISGSLATDYNGTTQYGTAASATIASGPPATIFAHANHDTNATQVVIGIGNAQPSLMYRIGAGNLYELFLSGVGGNAYSASAVSTGSWASSAGASSSTTSRIMYRNGTAGTAATTNMTSNWAAAIRVGARPDNAASPMDGKIAFAGVYSVAASADWLAYWHNMLADPDQSDFYNGWTYASISSTIVPLLQRMQLMSLVRPTQWDRFVSLTPIMLEK